jgi:AraC-like DNA-binding protein
MQYREQGAARGLDRWVECVWAVESAEAVEGYAVRPDGCLDILWSGTGLEVVGAMTAEQKYDLAPGAVTCGLRFRPGMAASFLRVPAGELTDRVIRLEDLWGAAARGLESRLGEAGSSEERLAMLAATVRPPAPAPNAVQQAIEAMTASHGDVDLEWMARQARMSERQFRRRCLEESGLGPKQLCRVLRFRRACELGQRGLPWGLVAVEAGYFDQAHLIRDFREFAGGSPSMSVFSNTADGRSG